MVARATTDPPRAEILQNWQRTGYTENIDMQHDYQNYGSMGTGLFLPLVMLALKTCKFSKTIQYTAYVEKKSIQRYKG